MQVHIQGKSIGRCKEQVPLVLTVGRVCKLRRCLKERGLGWVVVVSVLQVRVGVAAACALCEVPLKMVGWACSTLISAGIHAHERAKCKSGVSLFRVVAPM